MEIQKTEIMVLQKMAQTVQMGTATRKLIIKIKRKMMRKPTRKVPIRNQMLLLEKKMNNEKALASLASAFLTLLSDFFSASYFPYCFFNSVYSSSN